MPELTTQRAKKPPMSMPKKIGLVIIAVLTAGVLAIGIYIHILTGSIPPPRIIFYGASSLTTSMVAQRLLAYNFGTAVLPYFLLHYSQSNISILNVSLGMYSAPPPKGVYVLNWTNQCFSECGSIPSVISALTSNLVTYGVFNSSGRVRIVNEQNVSEIPNDSILILLNGYLPDFMLNSTNGQTMLGGLLSRGTTILYVGGNFSHLISSGSVVIPNSHAVQYLATAGFSYPGNFTSSGYYFNQTQFAFFGGKTHGPAAYESVESGAIVAFSNFLARWPSPPSAGHDLATAIYQLFWMPTYASGIAIINTSDPSNSIGFAPVVSKPIVMPVLVNDTKVSNETAVQNVASALDGTYGRMAIVGTSPTGNSVYNLFYFKPSMFLNGVISIPANVTPGQSFNTTASIFINNITTIEPHFDIFNQNLSLVASLPPLFTKQVSPPSYSFLKEISIRVPSGSYIAQLDGFSNQNYGASYFTVPPISITSQSYDFNTSTFYFTLTAAGVPLNNLNSTVSLDGQYTETRPIYNGTLLYNLSQGESLPQGKLLNFTLNVLGANFTYQIYHVNPALTLNRQYIEFILTLLIVVVEITIIKAPQRDDFYVDVSSMPRPALENIRIKYSEFLGVFDKLNMSYHWRYMPLSKGEFRIAVSNNIHSNAMPVMLTYKNIDLVLDQMVAKGYLVAADDLYAPVAWIEQSKHDIEYLATFKKLRIYLVSHGHMFTDLDKSDAADIVTTLHNEKAYLMIYSPTSRFKKMPVYGNSKTYLVFMNEDMLETFKMGIYNSVTREAEEMKIYLSVGSVVLIDADSPEGILS